MSWKQWQVCRWVLVLAVAGSLGSAAAYAGTADGGTVAPGTAVLVDAPSAVMASWSAPRGDAEESETAGWSQDTTAATQATPDALLTRGDRHRSKFEQEAQRNTECETGQLHGKPCRVSWPRVLGSSLIFMSAQHGGNILMDSDTRAALTGGNFWHNYVYCVEHYRWSRWKDDDPFGVDYIGHPMMGALASSIYEQNDPKQRALTFENSRRYWMGRLKAMGYSAAYSAQWKVGPASEASIGNTGITYYVRQRDGVYTNETGMQDFFVTPIGGFVWNVGEDVIDRYLSSKVRRAHPHNRMVLFASSFMTPMRGGANVARFRPPYYRDADQGSLAEMERIVR